METVKKTLAMMALVAGLANTAYAEVGLVGEVGTTGVGGHVVIPLRKNMNARLGMGYLTYSYSGSTRDMNYDLSMKARTYDALLDWYPREHSSFHVTGGLAYNGNKIDAQARPNSGGNYTVNGNSYSAAAAGKITGQVDFGKVAPYLGVGWSKASEKGWSFSTDVGMLFQGSPHTSLSSSGCTAGAAACNQLATDVAKENARLSDEVSRFKVYPVLRVGVSYKF
ncbi:hypothetical protein [Noviherbaspirillum autotrophicum]|uniref:hypothetical protein n=1 Tax=Noviherbaspirillum autotrophicum TaxID=709839 RepID=UPI00267A0829